MPGVKQGVAACVAMACWCPPAGASDDAREGVCARWAAMCGGSVGVAVENDIFAGTDRNYTSGVEVQLVSGPKAELPTSRLLSRALPSRYQSPDPNREWRTGLEFGHVIYTPSDIDQPIPDPTDRPYAGWAFVTSSLYGVSGRAVDIAELTVGLVGDGAGGAWVQRNYHQLINGQEPRGWRFQIKDEPGVIARLGRQRHSPMARFARLDWEAHGHGSIAVGNVDTSAALAVGARTGRGFRGDHGEGLRVQPAVSTASFVSGEHALGWYAFADFGVRAVARDIFLDGNSFRDSARVDKRRLVNDLQGGLAVYAGRTRVTFTYVRRSEEFRGQQGAQRFGSVALAYRF